MQTKTQARQIVNIPNNINIFYCKEKKIIIFKGPLRQKSLKINNLLTISYTNQHIEVKHDIPDKLSNYNKKKLQSVQGTTVSLFKQVLIEITVPIYQKLKLVGVGYRVFPVENFEDYLLLFRLGYSHPIYFKIPSKINIFCLKLTKLFIYGHSYQQLTSTASRIRLNKIPEPYKGKGILYENEKIILKEGKKI